MYYELSKLIERYHPTTVRIWQCGKPYNYNVSEIPEQDLRMSWCYFTFDTGSLTLILWK